MQCASVRKREYGEWPTENCENLEDLKLYFLAFFMRYFFNKIIFLEASACSVSTATQNHSLNCDIFDDNVYDVYDDDEKIKAFKTVA